MMNNVHLKAKQVAAFFLELNASSEDNDLTQLKLQKLLYYAQGVCLAISGKPLFEDKIKAWPHGPVCNAVYDSFPRGSSLLTPYEDNDGLVSMLSKKDKHLISLINRVYGRYCAFTLRNMTHQESPWRETMCISYYGEIEHDLIKNHFEKLLAHPNDYALQHSANDDEMEDIIDLLAVIKSDYSEDQSTMTHEEVCAKWCA